MSQTLVIVDSVSKYNILKKYLGDVFFIYPEIDIIKAVTASPFTFENDDPNPHFLFDPKTSKKISRLKEFAGNYQNIIIAADPGLRGELDVKSFESVFQDPRKPVKRVLIKEFTRTGIKQAFAKPVRVDNLLINSYQACLAINEIINDFNFIFQKYSVTDIRLEYIMALKLICEREDQIELFKAEKSNSILLELKVNDTQSFSCPLEAISGNPPVIPDSYHAKAIIKDMKTQLFKVFKISRQQKKISPPAPFTTIELIHQAFKTCGYSLPDTLKLTRELYEGIDLGRSELKGLITFYHTDSNYSHPDVVLKARELIYADYGAEYVPSKPYHYSKNYTNIEAIRPVDVKQTPKKVKKYLTDEQFNLYLLIWNRYIASQMSQITEEQTTVDISSDAENRYELKSSETKAMFRGYKILDSDSKQYNNSNLYTTLKALRKNQILQFKDVEVEKQVSTPVKRYNETGLLHELLSSGIEYSPDLLQTTGTLFANKLIKYYKEQILPTPTGYHLCHFVIKHFPNIYNPGFIAKISNELECIKKGQKEYITVLENFKKLQQHIKLNSTTAAKPLKPDNNGTAATTCPVCKGELQLTEEPNGQFLICENFPEKCHFAEPAFPSTDNTFTGEKCIECGAPMVVRDGRYGRFLACSKYPKCSHTKAYPIGVKCPQEGCSGEIVEKKTRNGRFFYGCNNYPNCKFASWHKPENILCEHCGNLYLVFKTDGFEKFYQCPKCHRKYDMSVVPVQSEVNN